MTAKARIALVREEIKRLNIDALLISSVSNITYFSGYSNFSSQEREAFLLVTKNKQFIITDGRYTDEVRSVAKYFTILEISTQFLLQNVFNDLAKKLNIQTIEIETDNITVAEHKKISDAFPHVQTSPIPDFRMVKDAKEIEKIGKACAIADRVFAYILKFIKPGITEIELAFQIEYAIRKLGAAISFPPIVAFGRNSAIPHHQTNNQRLKTNDCILLDFGAKVDDYCSDMTRTIFIGKADKQLKKMYNVVLEAHKSAIDYLTSHYNDIYHYSENDQKVFTKDIDKIARDYILSQGYPTIPHSLGHGIGIDVHEPPILSQNSKDVLKTGMVFSVEPGIYLSHLGGIRIEDLVVLEKSGPRLLTHSPKQLIEL